MREARAVAALGAEHRSSGWVVFALARAEAKATLRHPLFLGAGGLCALLAARATGRGDAVLLLLFGVAIGAGIGGFLSGNEAARRARRDRMGELFATLPSPREARTIAVLLGTFAGPMVLSVVVAEIGVAIAETRSPNDPGVGLGLGLQIPLVCAAFCAFAVALGRWIPSGLTAPVVLVAQVTTGLIWGLPWIVTPGPDGWGVGWHVAYLASFIVFASTAGLFRDRRTLVRAAVTAAGLGGVVISAILQAP
jgi:hypothetical protein